VVCRYGSKTHRLKSASSFRKYNILCNSSQKIKIKTTLNFHKNKNINKNKYCQEWPIA
jgi:hypothetical protein